MNKTDVEQIEAIVRNQLEEFFNTHQIISHQDLIAVPDQERNMTHYQLGATYYVLVPRESKLK